LPWSAVTALLRGAIGAAREAPETATISGVTTAIAKTVRVIFILLVFLLRREPVRAHNTQNMMAVPRYSDLTLINGLSESCFDPPVIFASQYGDLCDRNDL
jgi:hypothetical protein